MKLLVYILLYTISVYNHQTEITWENLLNENVVINSDFDKITHTDSIMFATKVTNIRSQANKDSTKLGFYRECDSVTVTGFVNEWTEVNYNGIRGYVLTECLSDENPDDLVQYRDYIYTIGYVPDYFVEDVNYNFDTIPKNIKDRFISDGSRLVVTSEDLGSRFFEQEDNHILGVCHNRKDIGSSDIYISFQDDAKEAVYHEIGHYMDNEYDKISLTDDFCDIWGEEVIYFYLIDKTNPVNIATPSEYFAEATSYYLLHQHELKYQCPKTYEFIDNCIENM